MAGLRDFHEFDAWKLANEVRQRIRRITGRAAFREHLWLRSQLRRSANSACVNGCEGFSRYRPKEFARFLEISKSSLTEIIEHMSDVSGLELATPLEVREICSFARRSRGATTKLIRYLNSVAQQKGPGMRRQHHDEFNQGAATHRRAGRTQIPENPEPQNPRTPEPQNPGTGEY